MVETTRRVILEEILNEKQIHHVLKQSIGDADSWEFKGSEIRPAMEGIAGFMGDHSKAVLHVNVRGELAKVHLFLKSKPTWNQPKTDFIDEYNFYKREMWMYKILETFREDGHPWFAKAYICTDSILVMPDLTCEGYASRHFLDTLDHQHLLLAITSVARFHAAFCNYETDKSIDFTSPYSSFKEFSHLLNEPTFCDTPWLRASCKLTANILKNFSSNSYNDIPDLESNITARYMEACDNLREYEETLNVMVHKDLWVNNIMFKYEDGVPTSAVLVDYQCMRYGPPAFDIMLFIYLTTDKSFREQREESIFDFYYSMFVKSLSCDSKKRLATLGYDKEDFLNWCDKARMFGMVLAMAIFPFILMDPKTAQKTFDDPETYEKYMYDDRSEPVIAYANRVERYKMRNLEICEEFVERYVLKQ